MKHLLMIILIGFFTTSCLTVKRISRNCDEFAKICLTENDTVFITKEVEVIYRDTTVEWLVHIDTVHWSTPVYIRRGLMNSKLSLLKTGLARSTAQVKLGVLKHFLQSGDTILQIRLDNALKEVTTLSTRLEKHQDIVTIKENTRWAQLCIKIVWISFIVIVILVLTVVFKNRLLRLFKKIL